MQTQIWKQVRCLAIIISVLILSIPMFAQVKKSTSTAPQKKSQEMNPFAALTPIESGAGVIIFSPKASDPSIASIGAGVSTWLQYQLTASPALCKMPMFSEIHSKREELHFQNLQLTLPQALDIAKRIGVTHILLGEITGDNEKTSLSYSTYLVTNGHQVGVPITSKGTAAEIITGMPGLAKRIAAALGDSQFPDLPKPDYTVKEVQALGRFTWSSKPDPKMSDIKALAEFGAKDPLAAIMGMRWYNYMSDRQIYKFTTQIDREAASNPLLIAETTQTSEYDISRWKDAIQTLIKKFTTSSLANSLAAKLQRSDKNTDEELKYAEKALRLNTGNPQYWLSLAHLYDTRASSLRQSRGANDITEPEWKKLNDDYAMWAAATIKAVELDDSNPHSWSRLAVAATFLSEKKIAYAAYDRGLELDPNNFEVMQWGLQMFQPKWFDDEKRMVNLLKHISEIDLDGNSAAYFVNTFQGFEIPSAPLTDRFLKRQRKIATDRPENSEPIYSLALFYGGTDSFEEAAKQYEKLLDMGILKENYFGRALSYWARSGNQAKSTALNQRRKTLFTEMSGTDNRVLGSVTHTSPNLSAESKPILIDAYASREHWVLARKLIMKKDRDGYEKEMVAAVESDVTNDYYHYELAGWYDQTGRKDEALAQYREAARVSKEDTYSYYLYSELKAREKMDEAIQEAKKGVLKENHRMVPLYIDLAKYEKLHDNIDNMKKMLDIGFDIQKGPHRIDVLDPDLFLLQGDMLLKQNKKAEARLAWQKAADYSNKEFSTVKDAKARLEANP